MNRVTVLLFEVVILEQLEWFITIESPGEYKCDTCRDTGVLEFDEINEETGEIYIVTTPCFCTDDNHK